MVLYGSVAGTALLGFVASTAASTATWGRLVDVVAGIGVFAVMGLWLRANRVALDCAGYHAGTGSTVRRVIRSRRPVFARRDDVGRVTGPEACPKVIRLQPHDNVIPRYDGR